MKLSPRQNEIVESDERSILVVAGAGCGKTTTLISYAMRNLGREGDPRQIVIAFSNKAANDVRSRVEETIPDYADRIFVGTIHQFCMDVIRRYGNTIGIRSDVQVFESEEDRLEIMRKAVMNIPSRASSLNTLDDMAVKKVIGRMYSRMSMAKKTMDIEVLANPVYDEYSDLLASMNAIDFDDIILLARRILLENAKVARLYRLYYGGICVDEAQDLNRAQYEFIKTLAGDSMRILMVGDPRQAIYGFAGASSEMMCKHFVKDFDAKRFDLLDNYRSSRMVVEAAKVIEPKYQPDPHVYLTGDFSVSQYRDPKEQATAIVRKIQDLMSQGHPDTDGAIPPERICVLARSRYLLTDVSEELSRNGIENTVRTPPSKIAFESDFFKALLLGIRVIVNPYDEHHRMALNRLLGVPLDSSFPPVLDGYAYLEALRECWDELTRQNREGTFVPKNLERMFEDCERSIEDDYEASVFDEDLASWRSMIDRYIRTSRPDRTLNGFVTAMSMGTTASTADKGVILSTVHQAKGLEFDAVFIISVNDGVFPSGYARTEAEDEEERHNMFVAITRSRRLCYVSFCDLIEGRNGLKPREPSIFIEELESWLQTIQS